MTLFIAYGVLYNTVMYYRHQTYLRAGDPADNYWRQFQPGGRVLHGRA